MAESKKLTCVVLRSLAMTGTTWVNAVMGSREDAFNLGPPDRAWNCSEEDVASLCLVHGKKCDFWPEFFRVRDENENWLLELSRFSGKDLIFLNNPTKNFTDEVLDHPDIELRRLVVVRDARATTRSMCRHLPDRFDNFYDAVRGWAYIPLKRLYDDTEENRWPVLKYEDLATGGLDTLNKIGEKIGLDYDRSSFSYWTFSQHLTAGNRGMIDLIQRLEGQVGFDHHRKEYYDEVLKETLKNPEKGILDLSWEEELSNEDRLAFDLVVGRINEKFGYERDPFSKEELIAGARKFAVSSASDWRAKEKAQRESALVAGKTQRFRNVGKYRGRIFVFVHLIRRLIGKLLRLARVR